MSLLHVHVRNLHGILLTYIDMIYYNILLQLAVM